MEGNLRAQVVVDGWGGFSPVPIRVVILPDLAYSRPCCPSRALYLAFFVWSEPGPHIQGTAVSRQVLQQRQQVHPHDLSPGHTGRHEPATAGYHRRHFRVRGTEGGAGGGGGLFHASKNIFSVARWSYVGMMDCFSVKVLSHELNVVHITCVPWILCGMNHV